VKVTDVKLIALRCPLPEPIKFSLGTLTHRNFALVRVQTDKGITGWGETFVNFPSWAPHERKYTVEQGVKPLLIGEDPLEPEEVTQKVLSSLYRLGLQWGAKGCMYQAVSGANIALWDIKGKTEGVPIYRLLGGGGKKVPLYAAGLNPSKLEADAESCLKAGFRALKIRIGFDIEIDLHNIRKLRGIAGPEVKIYVDVNQAWNQDKGLNFALQVEEGGADWIEEPVPCDELGLMSKIVSRLNVPLAAGENYFGVPEFTRAIQAESLDIGMPDITRVGGFGEMMHVCRLLRESGRVYSPHHYGTDVGFAASLHLMSAVPGGLELLRDISSVILKEGGLKEKIEISDAFALPPDKPGLGVEVDEAMLENYAY
jgi:L-alanine-DL-glutamate epimerase-like enolase superfamily enzyme